MTRWPLIFHFCLLWNAVVSLTELHLPCLVHCPWEALNCWRGRTERSFALNVTSPNVIYTTHWETDKAFKVLFCYPNRKWRKYPALNLASKTYHSLENCHRGNVSEKLPEQHLPGASNLQEIMLNWIRFQSKSPTTVWEEHEGRGTAWWGTPHQAAACKTKTMHSKIRCQSPSTSLWQCSKAVWLL